MKLNRFKNIIEIIRSFQIIFPCVLANIPNIIMAYKPGEITQIQKENIQWYSIAILVYSFITLLCNIIILLRKNLDHEVIKRVSVIILNYICLGFAFAYAYTKKETTNYDVVCIILPSMFSFSFSFDFGSSGISIDMLLYLIFFSIILITSYFLTNIYMVLILSWILAYLFISMVIITAFTNEPILRKGNSKFKIFKKRDLFSDFRK